MQLMHKKNESDKSLNSSELVDLVYQCSTDASKWPKLTLMLDHIDLEHSGLSQHLDRAGTILDALSRARKKNSIPSSIKHLPIGIAQANPDMTVSSENPAFISIARANPAYFKISRSGISICDRKLANCIRKHSDQNVSPNQHSTFMLESNIPTSILIQTNKVGYCTLLVSSQTAAERIHASSLKQLFGLTPSESRLVKQLCNGSASTLEAAYSTGITVNTARSQLKTIYQKVNVKTQVDLVKRILTSVAVLKDNGPVLPANACHSIFLKDGRKLEYSEYGDPDGFPVINFHSTGQSCKLFHFRLNQLPGSGIRLITASRPGIGYSSHKENFTRQEVAEDIACLLTHLKIKRCSLLAFANGGPFALAFAHYYPHLVDKVAIASSILPHGFGDNAGILDVRRIMLKLARSAPLVHRHLMRVVLRNIEKDPDLYLRKQLDLASETDKSITTPEMFAAITDSFFHAVSTTLLGTIHDFRLSSLDWEFEPLNIQVPITFWHGADNHIIKAKNVELFSQYIPSAQYHQVEGGHLIYYSHFEQMLESLRQEAVRE